MFNLGNSPLEHDASKLRPLVMERSRLMSAATAGAGTVLVNSLPRGVTNYSGWVVISPYGTACEVRRINSRSGKAVVLGTTALAYAHSRYDEVMFLDVPELSVKWFGALGDGTANDGTAIVQALNQCDISGGKLVIPSGTYLTTIPIYQPRRTIVKGHSSNFQGECTVVKATTGFSGSALWIIGGTATTSAFGTYIEDMCIDGGGTAQIGVYSNQINENSGLNRVRIRDFRQYGAYFKASGSADPRNWFLNDVYITAGSTVVSGDEIGLYIDGLNSGGVNYNNVRGIDGITVDISPNGTTNGSAGIQLINCRNTMISRAHFEGVNQGLHFKENNQGCIVAGVSGNGKQSLVDIGATDNDDIVLMGIRPYGAGTCVTDNVTGVSIGSSDIANFYVLGDSHLYHGTILLGAYDMYSRGDGWQDWSGSSTITGWSGYTIKQIYYKRVGFTVYARFNLAGTSNANSASFTLPYTPVNVAVHEALPIVNGGTSAFGRCVMNIGNATVSAYSDAAGSNWATADAKTVRGSFEYQTSI